MPARLLGGLRVGGFIIALVGFLLTRFIVAEAVTFSGTATTYLVTSLPPLLLGFGLSLFGIGLAVSTLRERYVRVIAVWCLLGTGSMIAILGVTLLDPMSGSLQPIPAPVIANVVLGGAIGGTLTGVRSAQNHERRRELARQRDQATLLNRVLRDEVLNAVAVISGRLDSITDGSPGVANQLESIRTGTDRIEDAIAEIGFIVRTPAASERSPMDVMDLIESRLTHARSELPETTFNLNTDSGTTALVHADPDFETAIDRLLELASDRSGADPPEVEIDIATIPRAVNLAITIAQGELSDDERQVLETGTLPEHDNPQVDFRVSIVSLLVNRYDGTITTEEGSSVTITISLPLAVNSGWGASRNGARYGVSRTALRNVSIAALLGGIAMGGAFALFTGNLPVIGALYGIPNATVGWISHLFHSLVFGAIFAAIVARPAVRKAEIGTLRCIGMGIGFGIFLWFFAAGLIMPLWLNALGYSAPFPNLDAIGLVGHVLWGGILGAVYAVLPEK